MNIFSDISFFWLIPIALLSAAGGYWYYHTQHQLKDVSRWVINVLTIIRSTVLFVLFLLLLGILIETKDSITEKPVFITLIDNSTSMLNYKDSSQVERQIDAFQKEFKSRFGDRFELVTYGLDNELARDSIEFGKRLTDLNASYDFIYNQYYNRNIGGIALISDGNFNQGQNPVYTAEKIALTPMFCLTVGDTIQKKDQLIKTVSANQIAYLGNQFPIEVDIESSKLQGVKSKIQVVSNSKIVLEKEIQYSNESINFQHHVLMLNADKLGFVQYEIRLRAIKDEVSFVNNSKSIYIEVLDSRNKVLILANAPHPDVTALKQVLDQDDKLEVESKIIDQWKGNFNDYQLIVLHGPKGAKFGAISKELRDSRKPILVLVDNQTKQRDIDGLGINLQLPANQQQDEVQGYIRSEFQLFEISEKLSALLEKAPPLQVPFGKTISKSGEILVAQRIGKVEKQDPLIFFGKNQTSKYGVFIGEGLWRWKLSEYSRTKGNEGFTELIQRSAQYLVAQDIREPLRVILPRRYNVLDDIVVSAEFYNEASKPITTPDISFTLKNEKGVKFDFSFAKMKSSYQLNLGVLSDGKYTWIAKASHNGKKHVKEGEFVVEEINIEDLRTTSDFNTLSQIANVGGGRMYALNDMSVFFDQIETRKDIVNVTYEESDFNELIEILWMLGLLLILLVTEWFLRRYFGTY